MIDLYQHNITVPNFKQLHRAKSLEMIALVRHLLPNSLDLANCDTQVHHLNKMEIANPIVNLRIIS